jgi:hypothetical protein
VKLLKATFELYSHTFIRFYVYLGWLEVLMELMEGQKTFQVTLGATIMDPRARPKLCGDAT